MVHWPHGGIGPGRRGGMADTSDLKSLGQPCGFDSRRRHHQRKRPWSVYAPGPFSHKYARFTRALIGLPFKGLTDGFRGVLRHLLQQGAWVSSVIWLLDAPSLRIWLVACPRVMCRRSEPAPAHARAGLLHAGGGIRLLTVAAVPPMRQEATARYGSHRSIHAEKSTGQGRILPVAVQSRGSPPGRESAPGLDHRAMEIVSAPWPR